VANVPIRHTAGSGAVVSLQWHMLLVPHCSLFAINMERTEVVYGFDVCADKSASSVSSLRLSLGTGLGNPQHRCSIDRGVMYVVQSAFSITTNMQKAACSNFHLSCQSLEKSSIVFY